MYRSRRNDTAYNSLWVFMFVYANCAEWKNNQNDDFPAGGGKYWHADEMIQFVCH